MEKLDPKREFKALYNPPSAAPVLVEAPAMNFLMVDGQGDPNTSAEFQQAVEALYAVSYTLKLASKKGPLAVDYKVMPLEGLWWADDMREFSLERKDEWEWTAMIAQPEIITREMVAEAVEAVREKKAPSALGKLRFERFDQGLCAQIMHIGPYAEERPMMEKMRTVIRQPVG